MGMAILGASLTGLRGQATGLSLEDQLRSQYHLTRVGANGVVVGQPGSVLVMQEDGLFGIPAARGKFWYCTRKKDGRIKPNAVQHVGTGFSAAMAERRSFQVGEKMYLTNLETTPTEIVFYVQTCGACDLSGANPNDPPYRARLAVQFEKDFLSAASFKQVAGITGRIFGIDAAQPAPPPQPQTSREAMPPRAPVPAAPLKLPASYVKAQSESDQLQLNTDNSFVLQEAGQAYRGSFVVNGNTLELNISETNTRTTVAMQGTSLMDSNGQTWVLREQPVRSAAGTLQNQDVIKMAKAGFDDAIIIAKIGNSKCQFDTSTDALIQLKQSGVSQAVLSAMLKGK